MEVATSCKNTEKRRNQNIIYIRAAKMQKRRMYLATKRIFDFIVALAGIIFLMIPMAIISLIIVLDSAGNPIFRQERLGKDGVPFIMYKFRSMRVDAETDGPQWAAIMDRRCTRFGIFLRRTRLDELPQLWNILKGEMSLVGPRPERQCFYEEFEKYIIGFSNRLAVTPGLTGHAQVNGGYELKPEEKILYDMEYIENCSIWFDIKCLAKTVLVVLCGNGAR